MNQKLPQIQFSPAKDKTVSFEIISIDAIKNKRSQMGHDPEQPHQIKFYNLIYFTEGSGKHLIDFKWYPVQKNSLVYLAKDQVNAFDFSGDLEGFCVIFTEAYFVACFANLSKDFMFRLFNPQLFSPILQSPKENDLTVYFDLLQKEFEHTSDIHKQTILQSLFIVFISKAERIKQGQTLHIKDSKNLLKFQEFNSLLESKHQQSRSATYYADALGISYKHLNVVCKEFVHKTAKRVIDDYIILQAKRSLLNSEIKSTELGYSLGFEDPTNFVKYFKLHTGFTPNSFKKHYLK